MNWCRIFGHRFQPRYDQSPSYLRVKEVEGGSMVGLAAIAATYRQKTYVKDICVRCGEERRRDDSPQAPVGGV